MSDLKTAVWLLFTAVLACTAAMIVAHSNWVIALDALQAENAALEEVIALQAAEGDLLMRQIGEMAERGFCETSVVLADRR